MIDRTALLRDLKAQLRLLEEDLRQRSADVPEFDETLRLEWEDAKQSNRTASTYEAWLEDRITQSAVAWILATVFIRFCEDNRLIDLSVLAGPGDRLAIASERQQEFFAAHPAMTDRDWILQGVAALSVSKVAAGLFDEAHNPMWTVTPSHEAAKDLLAFWRRRGEDGEIVHDFADPDWNTRFLGDLYQDLSEHAKKTYALLQTPEFVEEFILDYTLVPAIEEFGLTPDPPEQRPDLPHLLRVIDPTCGSGHFLLGAFHRLLAQWEKTTPDADRWEQISRALSSVHGVDKNAFAAAIARFRLLIAAMKAAEENRLADAPEFPVNVAVGDSLLHGRGAPGIQVEFDLLNHSRTRTHTYVTEDILDYSKSVDVLGVGSYHVVVGNPPYITVKDNLENENYRKAYPSCSGKYALSVPFAERFFQLAIHGGWDRAGSGYVGQITANSFMRAEFGKKLIEEYLQKVDITHVIDTSGAFIPNHGTPTVILVGRRRWPRMGSTIRAVQGVRGEPEQPRVPAHGQVWTAIIKQINHPGSQSEWVSVSDLDRERLGTHPWTLAGGGALELLESLSACASSTVASRAKRLGVFGMTNADEIMLAARNAWIRRTGDDGWIRRIVAGDELRDWQLRPGEYSFFPYDDQYRLQDVDIKPGYLKALWPWRTIMGNRATFTKGTYFSDGRPWYEWHQVTYDAGEHPWAITFAFVATHNHFVLDRGGKIFNRPAPVIKLAKQAAEKDHLMLLDVLNSSVACFWMRQVCQTRFRE